MDTNDKLVKIIEYKKLKGSIRKPKYATRKLSIGLVSCMLGYALLVSPSSVEAAEETTDVVAAEEATLAEEDQVEESNDVTDEAKEEAVTYNEENAEDTLPVKDILEDETTEEAPEDVKEEFKLTEEEVAKLKEADFTEEEIKEIEKEAKAEKEKDENFDVESFLDKKIADKKLADEEAKKAEETDKEEAAKAPMKAQAVDLGVSDNQTEGAVRSSDIGEVQDKAIYSPGTKGQKQSYSGKVYIYEGGNLNDTKKGVGGVNVYLQWVNGKGVTSPVYYTTSNEDGTFTIDLTKTVKDKAGKEHGFKLAGDGDFVIRTWADNPDSTKYNIVKHGDEVYGFHNRLNRVNESWDFTAGINRIVNGEVALQEKPLNESHLVKDESEWQKADTEDGAWANEGNYGTVRGRVWYETGDPVGGFATYYGIDSNDIRAAGTKVVASYLNDEVTNLLDAWKKANKGYTKEQFRAAQKEIIAKYEAEHGKGSHIAETVVTTVDKNGNYYIPFRGLYGVSSTKQNSGLKGSWTVSDEEYGTLVRDEDINHKKLMQWNGTVGQKHRHINEDYLYVSTLVDNYGVYSNTAQTNMFDDLKNGALTQTLKGSNISQVEFAIIHPQTVHDITNYDTTTNYARKGDVAETETGGLLANREYLLQWFREGKAVGDAITVKSDANGKLASNPFTVPDDVTEGEVFTSAIYLPGANTKSLQGALAMDSFITTDKEDEVKNEPVGQDITVEVNGEVKAEDGIKNKDELAKVKSYTFKEPVDTSKAGDVPATVVVEYEDGTKDEVPITVKVTAQAENTADNLEPAYTDADAEAGKPTTITAPNFTDKDGKEATKPEGTKFALGKDAPKGATIDENTGEIKYTPTEADAGKEIDIPVVVTYPDNSTDNVVAKVTVAPADTQAPAAPEVSAKDDGSVTVTPPTDEDTKTVDITYIPEGQTDPVTVTATKGEDGNWTLPEGSDLSIDPATGIVTIPADKVKDGTEVTSIAKDNAGNKSKEGIDTVKTPAEKDAEKYEPKTTPIEKEKGTATTEDDVKSAVTVPDYPADAEKQPEIKVDDPKQLPDGNTPGEYEVDVTVTYPDGTEDKTKVKVTVKDTTPAEKDADKYDPTVAKEEIEKGGTVDLTDNVSNLGELPEGTKVEDVTPEGAIDTQTPGDYTGKIKVTYPDGSSEEVEVPVTVKDTTPAETDAEKNPAVAPEKTEVEDKTALTPEEKAEVEEKVKKANPEAEKVEVGDDGSVTLTYPDKSTNTLTPDQTVVEKGATDAGKNPAVAPEKTEVEDKTALTPEEKAEVEEKVKKANPEAEKVEVGDDGSVTLTYPDKSTNTLTPDQTVVEKGATDAEKNPAVAPEKTEVEDKTALTPEEKAEVEEKVKKANPEAEKVEVGDDGSVTLTYPDGTTNTLTPDQTVTEKGKTETDAEKNPAVAPNKTEVEDKNNLTEEEKNKVKEEVKKANPKAKDVDVDNKGNATLTYPDGSTNTLTPDQTVTEKGKTETDAEKNPAVAPDKTEVEDKNNLTEEEKNKVKEEVKKANPKAKDVDVDNKGNATLTYPDGSKNTLTPDQTVTEKGKTETDAEKNPAVAPDKTEVEDKNNLTEEEKNKVKEEVKKANPKAKDVDVDNKGNATLTYPDGSKNHISSDKTVTEKEKSTKDKTDAENNPAVIPSEKTGVADKDNLTDAERREVADKVKKANPKAKEVMVDAKGKATLIYPDGSRNYIAASELIYEKAKGVEVEKTSQTTNKTGKSSNTNVKTGVESLTGVMATLATAVGGLFVSKKRKDDDK